MTQLRSIATMAALAAGLCMNARAAAHPPFAWTEDFSTDPLVGGRFEVPPSHDPSRFSYASPNQRLIVHYDTFEPTAWYLRLIDPANGTPIDDCDDFEFAVTFRIRSAGFFADPNGFAQLGWGLLNSATTGEDRAGGSAGPYAFDVVSFDYFPNVSPLFGGPTLATTIIHSDLGQGFFSAFEFPFGPESDLTASGGDQGIALDTPYTGRVAYDSGSRVAVLTVHDGSAFRQINIDGGGGPGGPDGDVTTIQTVVFSDDPFEVDSFALTAWQDNFNPFGSTVIADVEISRIDVGVAAFLAGDMNRDGRVDGDDIPLFVQTVLSGGSERCAVRRADFNGDQAASDADVDGFTQALVGS